MNDSIQVDTGRIVMSTKALLESARIAAAADSSKKPNEIESITAKLMLKKFLTIPTSSSIPSSTALLTVTAATSTTVVSTTTDSMITKEVNDTNLNLTKILYESDRNDECEVIECDEKEYALVNGQSNCIADSQVDDDDRLVIDISDDVEKRDKRRRKVMKGRAMPTLEDNSNKFSNQLPRSFTYNLDPTSTGGSSSVKIDILASTMSITQAEAASSTTATTVNSQKITNSSNTSKQQGKLSQDEELNLLGHEIDRQMNKKTNEILELIKAYLSQTFNRDQFHEKMAEIGNVTMSDLSSITRKIVKRHKFEVNPNQHYFLKMRLLQFPTSAFDLVTYFENLFPSMNKEKFVDMIKFYEICIKELLNLNRTKILQYLLDFMIKRKNSDLDLLNFNYLTTTGPALQKKSQKNAIQLPDSTQQAPSEKKPMKFLDTSYNFILRSDPIYIMACSRFQTNIRNVIRCRSSIGIQSNSFERRPFDNNILRNRRIGKRLVCEREELKEQVHVIPEKMRRSNEMRPAILVPLKIQNLSPILVESDTPPPSENSSPPIIATPQLPTPLPMKQPLNQAEKPKVISQLLLQRAYSERPPISTGVKFNNQKEMPKIAFPKMTETSPTNVSSLQAIKMPAKRRLSTRVFDFQPLIDERTVNDTDQNSVQHISVNELKTLSDNGTEIIPTSILRNTISNRRKTVDERAPIEKLTTSSSSNVIFRRIAPIPHVSAPIKSVVDTSNHKVMMKRRQSCHERILAPTKTPTTPTKVVTLSKNEANLTRDFMHFFKHGFELSEKQKRHQQLQQQQQQQQQHAAKRVRFLNETENHQQQQQQVRAIQYPAHSSHQQQQQQQQQQQSNIPQRSPYHFEQQHQKFLFERAIRERIGFNRERELRERGFFDQVETLVDREHTQNYLKDQATAERYQQQLQISHASIHGKPMRFQTEKSSRLTNKSQVVMNEEKIIVAYQQLASLRESSGSTTDLRQYEEHIKQRPQQPSFLRQESPQTQGSYHHNTQPEVSTTHSQQHYYTSTTATTTSSSSSYPIISSYEQDQSLQRKLKSKTKSSTYVEPNQINQPFFNPPISTYYTDPHVMSLKKKNTTPTTHTAFQPLQQQFQQQQPATQPPPHHHQPPPQQIVPLADRSPQISRNMTEMPHLTPNQLQNYWLMHQQHQQQANQLLRPIPIQGHVQGLSLSAFADPKVANVALNAYHQQLEQQQSEYYRQFYNHHYPKNL